MRSKKREALENLKADKFDLEGGTCIQNGTGTSGLSSRNRKEWATVLYVSKRNFVRGLFYLIRFCVCADIARQRDIFHARTLGELCADDMF